MRANLAKKNAAETKKKEIKSGLTTLFEAEKMLHDIANNPAKSEASAKNDSSDKILVGKYDPDKSTPRQFVKPDFSIDKPSAEIEQFSMQ